MAQFQKMSVSITVRMTPQQQQVIRKAADELGMTAGDFMRQAALDRAQEILRPKVEEPVEIPKIELPRLGAASWFYVDEIDQHIPCCRVCGTGPLEDEQITDGRCQACKTPQTDTDEGELIG